MIEAASRPPAAMPPEDSCEDLLTPEQWGRLAERVPLTTRQLEVAVRLCEGLSRKQIARSLRISPETVRRHIDSIYGKLGAKNVVGCVVRLVRLAQESRTEIGRDHTKV